MIIHTEWLCPVCDSKNRSEHPVSEIDEEKFHTVFCAECEHPIVIGVTLYTRVIGYELHEMKLDHIRIVGAEKTQ